MKSVLYAGLFVALFALAGARDLSAAAPAPAQADESTADLLFVLQANQAEFSDSNTLRLTGVPSTVAFYGAGAKAGVLMVPVFANSSAGAAYVASDGAWLSNPDAALIGDVNNSDANEAVLLQLSSPVYDAVSQAVTFNISVLQPTDASLKLQRGVANELVAERANGATSTTLITAVQPGATMSNVALFIDENRASLKPDASTKTWWLFCGPWCWGGGGWGWGGGGWGGWGWGK